MAKAKIGNTAPDFSIPSTGNKQICLNDYRGRKVVLFFYPMDNVPSSTEEAKGFSKYYEFLKQHNTEVVGISRDSIKSHEQFKKNYGMPFDLAADTDNTVSQLYGVWVSKEINGQRFKGIEKSTFLVDETGTIVNIWKGDSLKKYLQNILSAVAANNNKPLSEEEITKAL